jgi:predicted DNA-binding protein (MmcQ/YjbR family)
MTVQDFRRIALEMDGAIERSHLNHPDFRAGGKIFATIHLAERQGMVKLTPEQQERVIREYPGAFHPASGMEGRQGCTMIRIAIASEDAVSEALALARENLAREGRNDSLARRVKARMRSR